MKHFLLLLFALLITFPCLGQELIEPVDNGRNDLAIGGNYFTDFVLCPSVIKENRVYMVVRKSAIDGEGITLLIDSDFNTVAELNNVKQCYLCDYNGMIRYRHAITQTLFNDDDSFEYFSRINLEAEDYANVLINDKGEILYNFGYKDPSIVLWEDKAYVYTNNGDKSWYKINKGSTTVLSRVENEQATMLSRMFDMQGRSRADLQDGLNIVEDSDGNSKVVLIK